MPMRLKLLLPTEVLVEAKVRKIIAEAENGLFCLLPRHIDFVAALVPGILYYTTDEGREQLMAVDEGTLVKCGDEVLVSVLNAVEGTDLNQLQSTVAESFRSLDEEERRARTALARLETGALRRILELEKQRHG
jgi:F-type H+-transporting ATPase subunit epsilon